MEGFVGDGEDLPDLVVEWTFFAGTFCASGGVLYLTVMGHIHSTQEIGALTRGRCLTIRGELHEKVIVVGGLLRPCEEIIEEPLRVRIVAPECAEIVVLQGGSLSSKPR